MIYEEVFKALLEDLMQSDVSLCTLISDLLNPSSVTEIWPEDYHRIISRLLEASAKEQIVKNLRALADKDDAILMADDLLSYEEFKKLHNLDTSDPTKAYVLSTKRDYIYLLRITPGRGNGQGVVESEVLDLTEVFIRQWAIPLMRQVYPMGLSGLGLCITLSQLEQIAKDISKLVTIAAVGEEVIVKALSSIISNKGDAIGFKIGKESLIVNSSMPGTDVLFKSSFYEKASLYDTVVAIKDAEKTKANMGKWLEESL